MSTAKKLFGGLLLLAIVVFGIPLLGIIFFSITSITFAPNPNSASMSIKRKAAQANVGAAFKAFDATTGFRYYASSSHDRCSKGRRGSEGLFRSGGDGYNYRCDFEVSQFYGFSGDFRKQMINFEQKITAMGWTGYSVTPGEPECQSCTLKNIMTYYYDNLYGKPIGSPARNYLVSDLPTPRSYAKGKQMISIDFAEQQTSDLTRINYQQKVLQDGSRFYDQSKVPDINQVFKDVTQENKFLLVITVNETYFKN